DIAQRLHMSVSQVEALEAGDYERLPRGTFLRGFTRNYARALGLDAENLVGLLSQAAPRESAPRIVVPSQNIRFDPLGQRLANPYVKAAGIAAAVLVLGFAAMYWWLFIRPQGVQTTIVKKPAIEVTTPVPAPAPAPVEPTKAEEPPAQPAVTQPAPAPEPAPAPVVTTPAAPAAAIKPNIQTGSPAEPAPAPAPGEGVIRLAFRAAAWVEITDARGKMLLSRTHSGGSSAEVVGKPPFTLVIGNAPEVRLTYNGREVDLAPHTRVAVARFTLP
ncbi:MAG TPA: helix-turn-helix domain-containing protein, partial [Usitatibacteraceae bacterium]|nr:helix-turn-helix domain-containing protein [Usitatibacteraceae bacterium]